MQQRNSAVVDMEAKLNEMKSKSDEYTDKVDMLFCDAFLLSSWIICHNFQRILVRFRTLEWTHQYFGRVIRLAIG